MAWRKAVESAADPHRARSMGEQLESTSGRTFLKNAPAEQARILAALFSGSQALGELILAHPDWLETSLAVERLQSPRRRQGVEREMNVQLVPLLERRDDAAAMAAIRTFKQREMLRIAARDLARLANATEITLEISNVADVCLDASFRVCRERLVERLGRPYHLGGDGIWAATEFAVFGMGKLGGQELNYSSDVDLLFVYTDEGHCFKEPPRKASASGKGMANFQFFKRLAEMFIQEVSGMAAEGTLYRIDMRLRPEGPSGPLTRSLASYENYYAQWGQTWERMMLIKTRPVAGDELVAAEFLEMIQSFRYPRSVNERILAEVAATKQRIETEVVKAGELDRNVKLGRGGIREIEFVCQTLQILHAGRMPFLQGGQTLPTLRKLVDYNLLSEADSQALAGAYLFLRDVEHRLQMENNLQTHTIPTERKARERLAALMGCGSLDDFEKTRRRHSDHVRAIYDRLLKGEPAAPHGSLPSAFEGAEAEWKKLLGEHSFRDMDKALQMTREFIKGPGYVHVSARTEELARDLFARLLRFCPRKNGATEAVSAAGEDSGPAEVLSDPDRVLVRIDSFISAYGARATLYELWTGNPSLFKMLILLFDRSEFLAEIAIRTPDLVDDLALSGRLRRRKNAAETLADLRHGSEDEDQRLWLRRYHQAELMRIGLREILGLADFEQNLLELTALADACLQYALESVLRRHRIKSAPFAIIGLGKLGGMELNYGSDLDILFVADSKAKNLPALQRVAVDLMEMISSNTELGVAFETDARLRPDGEKGLLVNTLAAYEEYYRERAQLWEIQAITRTRPIAGNADVGVRFQLLAATITNFAAPSPGLAAYSPNWRGEIARMRLRIEKERTPVGKQALAIKTGAGGLIDAEFIAQALALANGWQQANTLRCLCRAIEAGALSGTDGAKLVENYRRLRGVEGILRRWSYEGETELPDDPAPLYRVAVRCGYRDADGFMKAVAGWRAAIREVYQKVFGKA